jgi:L-threonylcarbamoyladenylate synthase
MPSKTVVVKADGGSLADAEIARLGQAAKGCKIIAFPTDTVYGLGSTALIKAASRRIYQIKQRPSTKPLPVLVHSLDAARRWVQMTPAAEALAAKFWPGGLTLVLRHTEEGRMLTFPEYQTLAIRVPNHPLLLKLIAASGVPWASTSANISDSPTLTDGAAVAAQFDGLVDFVVDAGPSTGRESTIVDASTAPARVTREGAIASAAVAEALKAAA